MEYSFLDELLQGVKETYRNFVNYFNGLNPQIAYAGISGDYFNQEKDDSNVETTFNDGPFGIIMNSKRGKGGKYKNRKKRREKKPSRGRNGKGSRKK